MWLGTIDVNGTKTDDYGELGTYLCVRENQL
jgi:hypothetical protein